MSESTSLEEKYMSEGKLVVEVSSISEDLFGFPFSPYKIQEDFMSSLFSALEDKRLGIFESPTGTVIFRLR
jgi:hypothetical protein